MDGPKEAAPRIEESGKGLGRGVRAKGEERGKGEGLSGERGRGLALGPGFPLGEPGRPDLKKPSDVVLGARSRG
jgi:hypothetical protein